MSETKWTPGPWEITSGFVGPLKIVASVDKSIDRSGKMEVAHVGAETFDRCRANARLISAAPDMYEALAASELVMTALATISKHMLEPIASGAQVTSALTAARAALTKARGEKP